jgi:CHRD domain
MRPFFNLLVGLYIRFINNSDLSELVILDKKVFGIIMIGVVSSLILAVSVDYNQVKAAEAKQQFKAKLKGENEVPLVTTTAEGKVKLKLKESNIKYKLNVTGITGATAAHIHQGKSGENGEPVVDLLTDGNKQKTSNGLFINGSIVDSSLIGPLKGKSISDLVSSLNAGDNYVNVHTQAHPDGEIRGQLELSGSANMTSAAGNETDTESESETSIVTPTKD